MNVNTLQASKRKNRLSIASLMIITGLGLITSNTASASHGHYNDGSNLSFSISYGYNPGTYVYYDSYQPVVHYRYVDRHSHYIERPRHHGRRGYKHGHKKHRDHYRGHRRH